MAAARTTDPHSVERNTPFTSHTSKMTVQYGKKPISKLQNNVPAKPGSINFLTGIRSPSIPFIKWPMPQLIKNTLPITPAFAADQCSCAVISGNAMESLVRQR